MPALELKNPTTTDNSVANSIPFNDWIAKTIQKTYSRPGDAVTYRPPSISQDNPELNLLNEKITVSIGAETNPNGTSVSGISGKGNAIVDDVNPQSGPIDPNSSTRWEVGGTPALDKKQIEITRAELPSVLAQDTNATFKDSLLGDKEYKVSDFFANQKKFENLKNTDSTVGNSIYSKFINYDGSKTDILYDKNNGSQPSIIPTRTAIWGQDQNQQEYVKQKLIETNGFTPDYVKQLTNRMYVFPNIQLDSNTQASIIKGEFGYDGIAQVAMSQDGLDPVQFAKNLAKLSNDKLDVNGLIRGTEAKEIRYDLNGKPIVTDRGDYAWNEALKNFTKDKDLNVSPGEFIDGAFGVTQSVWGNLSKSSFTLDKANRDVSFAEGSVKSGALFGFNVANTVFSNIGDALANNAATGTDAVSSGARAGKALRDAITGKTKPESNLLKGDAVEIANRKALQKSIADPNTGKAPENLVEGALNLVQNIGKGEAKLFDRKVINEQIAKNGKANAQEVLKTLGLREDASIAGVRIDDSAGTFAVSTVDFVTTAAISQGVGWLKGVNALRGASKLLPGWAGISMFSKDYRGIPIQDRAKEAAKTYASSWFESKVQDRFVEPFFDKAMLWGAQKEGSKLLAGVLTTPGLVSQFDDAFVQIAGLAKAPLKYKLMNAGGSGLIEFGVGVGGDALINSAFDGKVKPPTGDDWVQNALFGIFFAAAPKLMKSNAQMYGEVVSNLKVDKLGESVHGDLGSVINKISDNVDKIDVFNKLGGPATTFSTTNNPNTSPKDVLSEGLKIQLGVDNLDNVKGNFTLTESLSRDALINLVGSSTQEKGSKVSQSQRILNELLTKAAQATPDSPYNGFTKLYTLEGVNSQGEKTSEILALGFDKDGKPTLQTSDDLLKESGLEVAKQTNVAIDVLSNLVSSKNYTDFSNAQRGSIATYIEGGQPRMKFKDKTGNWINPDGTGANSNPPSGANFSLNVEQALEFIGIRQPINQLLKGNVGDSVIHRELLKVLSEEGSIGVLNRFKETIVTPENEVQTKGFEFNLDDDYAKEIAAEEARIQEVIPNQTTVDEYKAGDILSGVIPEKVSQAGAEAIIGFVSKFTPQQQSNLITSLPNGVSNNVNNWSRYVNTYNEYKDQIEVESTETAPETTKEIKTPKEPKQPAKPTETTQDSVAQEAPVKLISVIPRPTFFKMFSKAEEKGYKRDDVVRLAKIMTGNDFEDFDDLRLTITSQENTNLGNFFEGKTILNTREFPYQNNLTNKRLKTGMSVAEFRRASPPPVKVTKVPAEVVVPAETKPSETDKPSESKPIEKEGVKTEEVKGTEIDTVKTEEAKPKETTPQVAPAKEETLKEETKKDKKRGVVIIDNSKKTEPVKQELKVKNALFEKAYNDEKNGNIDTAYNFNFEQLGDYFKWQKANNLPDIEIKKDNVIPPKPTTVKNEVVEEKPAKETKPVTLKPPKGKSAKIAKETKSETTTPEAEAPKGEKPKGVKPKIDTEALKQFDALQEEFAKGIAQEANYLENNWDKLLNLIEQEKKLPFSLGKNLSEAGFNPISKVVELSGWKLPINVSFNKSKLFPEVISKSIKELVINNLISKYSTAKGKAALEEAYENLFIKSNSTYLTDPKKKEAYRKVVQDIQNTIYNLNNLDKNLLAKDVPTVETVTNQILAVNNINQLDIDNKKKETEYQRAYQESGLGGDYLDLDTKNIVNEDIRTKYDNFLNSIRDIWSNESKYQELILGSENIPAFKDGVNKEWNSLSNKLQNQIKEIYNSDYSDGQTGFNQDTISKIWDKGIVIKKDKDFDSEKAKANLFLEKVKLLIENESEIDNLQTTDIPGVFEQPISEIKRGSIITYIGENTKYGNKDINNGATFYVKFKLGENIIAFPNTKQNIQSFEDNQIVPLTQYVNFKVPKQIKVDNIFDLPTAQESKTFTQSYFLKNSNNKKLTKKDTNQVKPGDILSYAGETIPGKLKKEQKLIAKEPAQDGLLRLYPLTDIKKIYNDRNANVPTAPKWETIRENTQSILDELNNPLNKYVYDTLEPITFKAMDEAKEAAPVKDNLDLSKEEKFIELNDLFNAGKFDEYQTMLDTLSKKDQETFQEQYQDGGLTQAFYSPTTATPVRDYSSETLNNNILQSLSIADVNTLNNTAITTRSIRFGGDIMDKISNNSKRKLQSLLVDISNGNIGLSDGGGKLLEPATIVAFQKEITKRINTGKAIDMEFLANTIINGESLWRVINRSQNRNNIPIMEMNQELLDKGVIEFVPTEGKLLVEKDDRVKVKLANSSDGKSTYHAHVLPYFAKNLIKNKQFIRSNLSSKREAQKSATARTKESNKENIDFLAKIAQDSNLNRTFNDLVIKVRDGNIKVVIGANGKLNLTTPGAPQLTLKYPSKDKIETLRAVTQVLNNFDNSSLDKNRQFSNTLSNIIQTYDQSNKSTNAFLEGLLGRDNSSNRPREADHNENVERGLSYLLEQSNGSPTGRGTYKALQAELLNDRPGEERINGQGISNETKSAYQQAVKKLKDNKVKLNLSRLEELGLELFGDAYKKYDKDAAVINEALEMIRNQGGQDHLDGQLALLTTILPDDSSIRVINQARELYPELQFRRVFGGNAGLNNIRLLSSVQIMSGTQGSFTSYNNAINLNPYSGKLDTLFHELVHAKDTNRNLGIITERISTNPKNFLQLMYAFNVWYTGSSNGYIGRINHYLNQPFDATDKEIQPYYRLYYINPILERLKAGDVENAANIFGEYFNSLETFRQYNIAAEFNGHYQQMMISTGNFDKLDILTTLSDVPQTIAGMILNPVLPGLISSTDRLLIPSSQMEQAFRESPLKQAQGPEIDKLPKQQPQQVQWNQILDDNMKINLFKIQRAQRDDLAALQEMNKDLIRINNSKNSSIAMEDSQKEAIQTLNTLKKDLGTIKDYNSLGYDQWVNTYNDLADKLPTLDSQLAAMKYIGINQSVIDTMNNLLAVDPGYLKLRLDTIKFNTKLEADYGNGLVMKGRVNFRDKSLYITLTTNNKNLQTTITHELSHLLFDESARNKLRTELLKDPNRIFDIFDSLNRDKDVINSYLQGAEDFAIQEYSIYNTPEQTNKYAAKLDNQLALMTNIKDTMFYRSLVGQFYSGLTSAGKAKMETEYFAHLMEMAYQDGDYQTIRDLLKPANRVPIQLGFGQRGEYLSYNPMMDNRINGFDPQVQVLTDKIGKSLGAKVIIDINAFNDKINGYKDKEYTNNSGTVYGFTDGKNIYLNPDYVNAGTLLHEASHLWLDAVKNNNSQLYNQGKAIIKNSEYFNKAKSERTDVKGEDAIIDEALAMAVEDYGKGGVKERKLIKWLKGLWRSILNFFGINNPSLNFSPELLNNGNIADLAELVEAQVTNSLPVINNITKDTAYVEYLTNTLKPISELRFSSTQFEVTKMEANRAVENVLKGLTDKIPSLSINPEVKINTPSLSVDDKTKIYKKQFGETVAKIIRAKMSIAFDRHEDLIPFLKDKIPVKSQMPFVLDKMADVLEVEFLKTNKVAKVESNKSPFDLLKEVGYKLKETQEEGEVYSFKSYYSSETVLCTFNNVNGRLLDNIIFFVVKEDANETLRASKLKQDNLSNSWKEYLEKNNRKNEDGTYNLEGLKNNREDPFSTSVLSIQIDKDNGYLKVISRYNHTIQEGNANPDAVFDADLDKLVYGLESSLYNYTGIQRPVFNDIRLPEGIITDVKGNLFNYSKEVNGVYYGEGFYIKNGESEILNNASERMVSGFILNQNRDITNVTNNSGTVLKNNKINRIVFPSTNTILLKTNQGDIEIKTKNGELENVLKISEDYKFESTTKGFLSLVKKIVDLNRIEKKKNSNLNLTLEELQFLFKPVSYYDTSSKTINDIKKKINNEEVAIMKTDNSLLRTALKLERVLQISEVLRKKYIRKEKLTTEDLYIADKFSGDGISPSDFPVDVPYYLIQNIVKEATPQEKTLLADYKSEIFMQKLRKDNIVTETRRPSLTNTIEATTVATRPSAPAPQAQVPAQPSIPLTAKENYARIYNTTEDKILLEDLNIDSDTRIEYVFVGGKINVAEGARVYANNLVKSGEITLSKDARLSAYSLTNSSNIILFNGAYLYAPELKQSGSVIVDSLTTLTADKLAVAGNIAIFKYAGLQLPNLTTAYDVKLFEGATLDAPNLNKTLKLELDPYSNFNAPLLNNNRPRFRTEASPENTPNSFNQQATNSLKQILGKTLERIPAKGIALEVATREELMKVAENQGIKLRFIGDIGAKNLNDPIILENRQIAQRMDAEGLEPLKIKLATGWEKGAEGKWKYEMSDVTEYDLSKIKPNSTYKLADLFRPNSSFLKEYPDLASQTTVEFVDVIGNNPNTLGRASFGKNIKLISIKNTELNANPLPVGRLVPNRNLLELKQQDNTYSTLAHEVQHFIQYTEGFSTGGSSFLIVKEADLEFDFRLGKFLNKGEKKKIISDNDEIRKRGESQKAFDNYRSLSGEVESRNVQTRRYFDKLKAGLSTAQSTEDIARDKQITNLNEFYNSFSNVAYNTTAQMASPNPALTAYGSFQTVEGRKGILTLLDTIVNLKTAEDAVTGIITANHELGHAFVATLPEDARESFLRTVDEFNNNLKKDSNLDNAEEVAVEYLAREIALKDAISTQEANQKAKTLWEQFKSFVSRMWKTLTDLVRTGKLDFTTISDAERAVIDQDIVDEFTRLRDEFVNKKNIDTDKLAPFVQEFSDWLESSVKFTPSSNSLNTIKSREETIQNTPVSTLSDNTKLLGKITDNTYNGNIGSVEEFNRIKELGVRIIKGSILLNNLPIGKKMTTFDGSNMTVEGDVNLRTADVETFKGENMNIFGDLDLFNNSLKSFTGNGLTIGKSLKLDDNSITSFDGNGLNVKRNILLNKNPINKFNGNNLTVGGKVFYDADKFELFKDYSSQELKKKFPNEFKEWMLDKVADYVKQENIAPPTKQNKPVFIKRGVDLKRLFNSYNSSLNFPSLEVGNDTTISRFGNITMLFDKAVLDLKESVLFNEDANTADLRNPMTYIIEEYLNVNKNKYLTNTLENDYGELVEKTNATVNKKDFQEFIDKELRQRERNKSNKFDFSNYAELKVYGRLPANYIRAILAPLENKEEIEANLNNTPNTPIYYYSTPEEHVQLMNKIANELERKGEKIKFRLQEISQQINDSEAFNPEAIASTQQQAQTVEGTDPSLPSQEGKQQTTQPTIEADIIVDSDDDETLQAKTTQEETKDLTMREYDEMLKVANRKEPNNLFAKTISKLTGTGEVIGELLNSRADLLSNLKDKQSSFRNYEIEAGTEALGIFATIKKTADKAKDNFDKALSPLNPIAKAKAEEDAFYLKMFTGERLPNGQLPDVGFTYDANLDKVVPVFENVVKSVSDQTPFQRIAFNESIYAGNTIEKIFSDTPIGSILVTYYYDPKTDKDKESSTMVPKRVKPLDRLRFEDAVEKGALNSIDDILKQVTETPENKSVNNITISGIITPLTAYTVNQPLDFLVNGKSAREMVLNKVKNNEYSQAVKDYATAMRDLTTKLGRLKKTNGLSSTEGNAYTNIPLKAISSEASKTKKNDPNIKTEFGRKSETAQDIISRGDYNANLTASIKENIINSERQLEEKLFFQRAIQTKWLVKQSNKDGSKSTLDLEYEKLVEIEKQLENKDLPKQTREAHELTRDEIIRLFGRPTQNVTDMYKTYYNSLIGVDGDVYRINGAFQKALYVAGKVDVAPKAETAEDGTFGLDLLEKSYSLGNGIAEKYNSNVAAQLVANIYKQKVAAILNTPKLLVQNTLQVLFDGVFGTVRGLTTDLLLGRVFTSDYFPSTVTTIAQIPSIVINSTNSEYAPFLNALDKALGHEEFYAGYADEKTPIIAKAPKNWWVFGKAMEKGNRILTSQQYQKSYNGFIWIQQYLINKLGRAIGLLNVMPRMLDKAREKGLDLKDFDPSKKEFRELLSESVNFYEQVRPTGSSAATQSVAYKSVAKALPLEIILKGWMFSGFNVSKKNLRNALGRNSTSEMRIEALANIALVVGSMVALLSLFKPSDDEILSYKDNPTNGGQKNSKATFPVYIKGLDGNINVIDMATLVPGALTTAVIIKQIFDLTTNTEARNSYIEDIDRQYNPFSENSIYPKSIQAFLGETGGQLAIPYQATLNRAAGILQPNEKSISKENAMVEFVQNGFGPNTSAVLSSWGLPVGDVPDKEYRIYNEKTKKMEEVSKPRDTFSRLMDIFSPANNENINVAYLENGIRNAETQLARDKQNLVKNLASGKINQESYNQELAKLEAKQDKFNLDTVLAPSGASRSGGGSSGGGISGKGQSLSSAISSLKSSGKGNTFSIKYPKVKTPKSRLDKLIKSKDKLGKNDSNTIKIGKNEGFTTDGDLSKGARLKASGVNGGLSGLSSRLGGGISVKTPSISVKKPGSVSVSKGAKSSMPKLIPLKGIKAKLDKEKRIKL